MSQDYSKLEDQIGNAGGTENTGNTEQKGLGKLKHAKQILTGKADLDDQEQSSLDAFKKKGKQERAKILAKETNISDGWIPIDRQEMGIRSIFYPVDWEFYVKAAPVMAVKNWMSIDEDNASAVNKCLNEIVRTSVKIKTNDNRGANWKDINSWDRFWFILKVREATFAHGESKIEFTDSCTNCDSDITYTLNSQSLFYEFPDNDLIDKYWDGEKWNIDPQEYDVKHDPITLYTPKLGKDDAIIEWATAKAQMKQKIDENFIQYLMWMLKSPSQNPQLLDHQISDIYKEYKSWNIDMYEFMTDVIRNLTINPSENLETICPNCGQRTRSSVKFPNGIKTLFYTETKVKKFGSR